MNLKQLSAHVNDNIQNDRAAGYGLLFRSGACHHCANGIMWNKPDLYTLAPRTVTINGVEVNAGMDEAPDKGSVIYIADINNSDDIDANIWNGAISQIKWLQLGLIHEEEEDAIAMAKAMLNFQPTQGGE